MNKTIPLQLHVLSVAIATISFSGLVAACGGGSDSTPAIPVADAAKQDKAILLNVNNSGWFASYQGGLGGWDGTAAITSTSYRGAGTRRQL
jgi:hypothetical protein